MELKVNDVSSAPSLIDMRKLSQAMNTYMYPFPQYNAMYVTMPKFASYNCLHYFRGSPYK
jgi:hypothetical protein